MQHPADIQAQIKRHQIAANDSRFDAQMRGMFRRSAAKLQRELAALQVAA